MNLENLSRQEKLELAQLLEIKSKRKLENKIDTYFPDDGPLRRDLYKKHLEFFESGASAKERLALAANRVGKTESMGGVEVVYHVTGDYPHWWQGHSFNRANHWWVGGKTSQTVRDILQAKLLGPKGSYGTGLIRKSAISSVTPKAGGIPDAVDMIYIKHKGGGVSTIGFKSYDQKRQSFEGTKKDGIWLDEECPLDIYAECLLRTTDTTGGTDSGLMLLTFTPLMGLTELVLQFVPNGEIKEVQDGPRRVITATWDDVPHLSEEVKAQMMESIPPFQRDARTKGIPQLGSGAIYPVALSEIEVDDFQIPLHWRRVYGMDVGWKSTAAVWGALDPDTDILYIYGSYKRGECEPSSHAEAINMRMVRQGVIDPAAKGRSQHDGKRLIDSYRKLIEGSLTEADNSVETGIFDVYLRMTTGRLKIFKSCVDVFAELRTYRRDDKGAIVKQNDHLMDALRYLVRSGIAIAKSFVVDTSLKSFKLKPKSFSNLGGDRL